MRKSLTLFALVLPLLVMPAGPRPEAAAATPCPTIIYDPANCDIVELAANESLQVTVVFDWNALPFDTIYYVLSTPGSSTDPIEVMRGENVAFDLPASASPEGHYQHNVEYAPFTFCASPFHVERSNQHVANDRIE